jgi:GNAT superfamily N-acetyltransferase
MTMLPGIVIREMRKEDLAFAAGCTDAEGWVSENYATLEGFFLNDPGGCLLAEENNRPVGICVATPYGRSGFIGELIVRLEERGQGVGASLLKQAVQKLMERGAETIYLDGVIKAVELYERNGFHKVCRSWRFTGRLPVEQNPLVRRMETSDLGDVTALDYLAIGADRGFFLRRRLQLFPKLCFVMMDGGKLAGFILGRSGEGWVSAGPWVVGEQVENPLALLRAFAMEAGDAPIRVGILDTNKRACSLVQAQGFVKRADSPWRMALGRRNDLGTSSSCYAVGSAAKG